MAWRDDLLPASFRGVPFHIENVTREGGRRNVPHEFPKRNRGLTEDMGRRLRAFTIDGYLIGPDHNHEADALVAALDADGPGLLVTPLQGRLQVICDVFAETTRREEGGFTIVSMTFVDAGRDTASPISAADTAGLVLAAANVAMAAVSDTVNGRLV